MTRSNQTLPRRILGRLAALTFLAALPFAGVGQAQTADRTVETFGQWDLTCLRITDAPAGAPAQACEIAQATRIQGRNEPVMQVAIGRRAAGEDLVMVLQLPLGVWLPAGVTVTPGGAGAVQTIGFGRCLPGACVAELKIDAETLEAMTGNASSGVEGAVVFSMQPDAPTQLAIAYRGFAEAMDALERKLAAQ